MYSKLTTQSGNSITAPWAEWISREGYTQDYDFGPNDSGAILKIITPWSTIDTTLHEIIGYAFRDDTDPNNPKLVRKTPMKHPRRYWMRAARIQSVRPVKWSSKARYQAGSLSDYTHGIVTIYFTPPRFEIFEDGVQEYQRYCTRTFIPRVEVLTLNDGGFKFTDGPNNGTIAAVPTGLRVGKMAIVIKWWQVPDLWIFGKNGSNNGGVLTNLMRCAGKVNPDTFLNYPAKTLYFEAPQLEEWSFPADPGTIFPNMPAANLQAVPRCWNVTIPLLHFDPPNAGVTVGHCGAPASDGLWYRVGSVNGNNNLYAQTFNFSSMFDANKVPA